MQTISIRKLETFLRIQINQFRIWGDCGEYEHKWHSSEKKSKKDGTKMLKMMKDAKILKKMKKHEKMLTGTPINLICCLHISPALYIIGGQTLDLVGLRLHKNFPSAFQFKSFLHKDDFNLKSDFGLKLPNVFWHF